MPPPCVFATQDSTRKDSTQNFNNESRAHELAHIRARESQTHIIMANEINAANVNVANAASVQSANAAEAEVFAEGTEKQFAVKVLRTQVFDDNEIVNVHMKFDRSMPGFTKDDDGDFIAANVDNVSITRGAVTKQLCKFDESIALLRDGQKKAFSRMQLATMLNGASLLIKRTFHKAGFVKENGEVLTRDQWFTDILTVKMSEFAKSCIQQVLIKRIMEADED